MFCTNCGNRLGDGAKFCSRCGKPAARVRIAEKPNPAKTLLTDEQRKRKGRGLCTAGLVLGIITAVLSLVFSPFVCRIFGVVTDNMTGADWAFAFFTGFLYSFIKMIVGASAFIAPCFLTQLTGLILALVGRANLKDKKLSRPAIIVNVAGFVLQAIILVVCARIAGPRLIT